MHYNTDFPEISTGSANPSLQTPQWFPPHTHAAGCAVKQPVVLSSFLKQPECSLLGKLLCDSTVFYFTFLSDSGPSTTFIFVALSWNLGKNLSTWHVHLLLLDDGQDKLTKKLGVTASFHCWRVLLPTWLSIFCTKNWTMSIASIYFQYFKSWVDC